MTHPEENPKVTIRSHLRMLVALWPALALAEAPGPSEPAAAEEPVALRQRIAVLERDLADLRREVDRRESSAAAGKALGENLLLSGEGALAFFDSQGRGRFPNREFRVDEARLYLEARLAPSVFLLSELMLAERENDEPETKMGELYLDVEDVANLWGGTAPLTLRLGRFQIPFGEEYQHRNADRNPLVSHSLSDLWGVDEGVMAFGRAGPLDYALAVQNGGYQTLRDGDPDKAVTLRVGLRPTPALRASASLMRTGDLSGPQDQMGELWFANSYILPTGDPAATRAFRAEVAEADLRLTLPGGHLAAAVGCFFYDDDRPGVAARREVPYGYLEAAHTVVGNWYAATRLSGLKCGDGYPVLGQGPARSSVTAAKAWRWSLGGGYRWSKQLVFKAEYSFEGGSVHEPDVADPAAPRASFDGRDLLSAEVVYGF